MYFKKIKRNKLLKKLLNLKNNVKINLYKNFTKIKIKKNLSIKEQKWEILEKRLLTRKIEIKLLKKKKGHRKMIKKNLNLSKFLLKQKNILDNYFRKIKKLNYIINNCLNKYRINDVIVIYDKNIQKNVLKYISYLYLCKLEDRNNKIKKNKFLLNVINDKIINLDNKINIVKSKHNKNLIRYFMFFNYITYRRRKFIPIQEKEKKYYNKNLISYFENKKSFKIQKKKKNNSQTVFSFLKLDIINKISKKIKMNLFLNNIKFDEIINFFFKSKFITFENILKNFSKFPFFLNKEDASEISYYIIEDNLCLNNNKSIEENDSIEYIIFKSIIKNLIKEYYILDNNIFLEKIADLKKVK